MNAGIGIRIEDTLEQIQAHAHAHETEVTLHVVATFCVNLGYSRGETVTRERFLKAIDEEVRRIMDENPTEDVYDIVEVLDIREE